MEEINMRFREIRELCGKTQEEWAKILGLSRSGVSSIESGNRKVTDKHLKILKSWDEKKVNIEYLKTGKGDPFIEIPELDEFGVYIEELITGNNDSVYKAIKAFMMTYGQLEEKSKVIIRQLVDTWIDNMNK